MTTSKMSSRHRAFPSKCHKQGHSSNSARSNSSALTRGHLNNLNPHNNRSGVVVASAMT